MQRTKNMCTSVRYFYKSVLDETVILSPIYQRDLVWTLGQKRAYIKAIFEEKAEISPTIILNWEAPSDKESKEVLDGKQRLSTIFEFIEDKFELDGGIKFSDLSEHDAMFFLDNDVRYTRIEKIAMRDFTLEEKIELFLEINELGTKMSQSHINKVKAFAKAQKGG